MTGPNSTPTGDAPPFDGTKYVTRAYGRVPEWKAHVSLGRAKSAVRESDRDPRRTVPAELWAYRGGAWELVVLQ